MSLYLTILLSISDIPLIIKGGLYEKGLVHCNNGFNLLQHAGICRNINKR